MDPVKKFEEEVKENIKNLGDNDELSKLTFEWMLKTGAI